MLYRLKTNPSCQIEVTDIITIKSVDNEKWSFIAIGEQFPLGSVDLTRFEPMYFEAYLNQLETI